ncbi:MAG TPA: hypothetical protein VLJ86_23885, partial [Ramlibacter sp.]|nr:hypothetical protein [Ramlibacter sp.]
DQPCAGINDQSSQCDWRPRRQHPNPSIRMNNMIPADRDKDNNKTDRVKSRIFAHHAASPRIIRVDLQDALAPPDAKSA